VIDTSDIKSEILNEFKLLNMNNHAFNSLRKAGFESFEKLGIPTTRHEEWKYINLKNTFNQPLNFGTTGSTMQLSASDVDPFLIGGKNTLVIVFENGVLNKNLSGNLESIKNVTVSSLASSIESDTIKEHLGKIASFDNEAFVALNSAFINDGIFIHVSANVAAETSIHLLHINTSRDDNKVSTVRNLIIAEPGSRVSVIESYHSIYDNSNTFTNSVTEIIVGKNAHLELVKAQLESGKSSHISFTQVLQERDSTFDTVTVTLGGALVRNNLHIKLNDVNCTSHLYGLYLLNGEQIVDNHTLVDHAMPNCFSNELYKGIIDGKASGVFNGKIFVRQDAQKTNAYQSNKNILLSDDAQMNTKPQLEIFADDVKCTHGATTGQIDEDALFYLRARGIGEQSARTLLNIAFVGDVLNNIKSDELRNNLQSLAEAKLML